MTTRIQKEILSLTAGLPKAVRLVAVSKYHPKEAIQEAYAVGQRIFGESHVQELQAKYETLPKDIKWHFIGHLQTNKVKYIASYITLIHAVDTYKLLQEINKQGIKANRQISCLLQLHIAQEDTKFGFSFQECWEMLQQGDWKDLSHAKICGIMCMASNTDNENQIRKEFHAASDFFLKIKQNFFSEDKHFKECSWGMSHDYPIAITEGSNLIRVGSKIFGNRSY